ncbi:MAG: tetratricopeptide repeat protein [Deltaproteobacteria bacterium]|nr:tetratricopeptide repeat protein [Deltaproteobacteria bacterium]
MISVQCPSCSVSFDMDERRIPSNGMRARCPQCTTTFHLRPNGVVTAEAAADLPASKNLFALDDLPAGIPADSMLLPVAQKTTDLDDPFGGISLPSPVGGVSLPSPAGGISRPAAASGIAPPALRGSVDLPSASGSAGLPSMSALGLPASQSAVARAPGTHKPVSLRPPAPSPPLGSLDLDLDAPMPPMRPSEPSFLATPRAPSAFNFEAITPPLEPVSSPPLQELDHALPPLVAPTPAAAIAATPPKALPLDPLPPLAPTPTAPKSAPAAPAASEPNRPKAGGFGELDLELGPKARKSNPGPGPAGRGGSAATLDDHYDLPLPPPPEPGPVRRGGLGFGEIELAGAPSAVDEGEFDAIPTENSSDGSPTIDTEMPVQRAAMSISLADPRAPRIAPVRPPPPKGLMIGAGVSAAILLSGAALSFTSAGAFGSKLIDEQLHGSERRAAAAQAIQSAKTLMSDDTYGSMRRALRSLDDQLQRTPNDPSLIAYDTFAQYFALARFGNDASIAGRARTLYERIAQLPAGTEYVTAARAARELAQGHADRMRPVRNSDPAILDLAIMGALDGTDTHVALDAARAASQSRSSVRTRFLLARALYLSDDRPTALTQAEALAREAPRHAGARLLAARILSASPERIDRAISLANEVSALGTVASIDERVEASVLVGDIEFARDRVTSAKEAFDRALELDPRAPAALTGSARVLFRQRSFAESLARYNAAATADPTDLDAALGVTMASLAMGRHAEVLPRMAQLAEAQPNESRVRLWWAKALLAGNDRPAGERELREAIRLDDTMLEAYTTLATLLASSGRPQEGEQVLERARGRVSDQAAIHRALGESRLQRGDFAGAESELTLALGRRSDDLRTRYLRAQVRRRLRQFDEALADIEAIGRADADYPGLLLERGIILETRGDVQGAVAIFRTALAREPQSAELAVHLGAALLAAGAFAEAEQQVSPVIDRNPNMAEAYFVLGRARLSQNNLPDAVRLLERSTELDATRADFRAFAGEANLLRGQLARALEHATQATEIDPTYPRGFWLLGEVNVRQQRGQDALIAARRALELDPGFADAMVTYAEADALLGQPAAAIELYRRAMALAPRPEWRVRYGRLLADAGRDRDAMDEFDRAAQIGDNLPAPPAWLIEAHRLGGEVSNRMGNRDNARRHFRRFIELAPAGTAGTENAQRALATLGS